jgi:hypothetical protein
MPFTALTRPVQGLSLEISLNLTHPVQGLSLEISLNLRVGKCLTCLVDVKRPTIFIMGQSVVLSETI